MMDMFGTRLPERTPANIDPAALRSFSDLRPSGGFSFIMADPPWSYEMYSDAGLAKSPDAHYATMSLAQIAALPVEVLAAPNCLLWLWAVGPMLPQALTVIQSWGFAFKTAGHWVKLTRHGKQSFGTGYILRNAGEPFLIATRGAPKTTRATRNTIYGKVREHSRKPEECYVEAEKLMPDAMRLDLFSRQRRDRWASWGNETEKFAIGSSP